jgi:hypothetical protein
VLESLKWPAEDRGQILGFSSGDLGVGVGRGSAWLCACACAWVRVEVNPGRERDDGVPPVSPILALAVGPPIGPPARVRCECEEGLSGFRQVGQCCLWPWKRKGLEVVVLYFADGTVAVGFAV